MFLESLIVKMVGSVSFWFTCLLNWKGGKGGHGPAEDFVVRQGQTPVTLGPRRGEWTSRRLLPTTVATEAKKEKVRPQANK